MTDYKEAHTKKTNFLLRPFKYFHPKYLLNHAYAAIHNTKADAEHVKETILYSVEEEKSKRFIFKQAKYFFSSENYNELKAVNKLRSPFLNDTVSYIDKSYLISLLQEYSKQQKEDINVKKFLFEFTTIKNFWNLRCKPNQVIIGTEFIFNLVLEIIEFREGFER